MLEPHKKDPFGDVPRQLSDCLPCPHVDLLALNRKYPAPRPRRWPT